MFILENQLEEVSPNRSHLIDTYVGHKFAANNLTGFGFSRIKPSPTTFEEGLEAQYTIETFARIHLFKTITTTPDIQFLFDPAFNPDTDLITFFDLRGRIAI